MGSFKVRLKRIRQLSSTTREFRFVRTDKCVVEFKPGQFFRFNFRDERGQFERSYSLCNSGEDLENSRFLDLMISTVEGGRATKLLFECDESCVENEIIDAKVTGPFGRLLIPTILPKRLFLVATSVGIAPYIPMLRQLSPRLKTNDLLVYFLYGTRDSSEFVYGDKLMTFAEDHPGFDLSVCYSRGMPSKPRGFEYKGYVQDRMKQISMNQETDHVLLCGNPTMVDEVYADLKQQGFTVRQVVREKYLFAKEVQLKAKTELSEAQKRLIAEKMKKYQS